MQDEKDVLKLMSRMKIDGSRTQVIVLIENIKITPIYNFRKAYCEIILHADSSIVQKKQPILIQNKKDIVLDKYSISRNFLNPPILIFEFFTNTNSFCLIRT